MSTEVLHLTGPWTGFPSDRPGRWLVPPLYWRGRQPIYPWTESSGPNAPSLTGTVGRVTSVTVASGYATPAVNSGPPNLAGLAQNLAAVASQQAAAVPTSPASTSAPVLPSSSAAPPQISTGPAVPQQPAANLEARDRRARQGQRHEAEDAAGETAAEALEAVVLGADDWLRDEADSAAERAAEERLEPGRDARRQILWLAHAEHVYDPSLGANMGQEWVENGPGAVV